MNFNDLLVPLLPTSERYLICTSEACFMEPFTFATTPIYWIGWATVMGCILLSGKKKSSTSTKKLRRKELKDEPKDDREQWEIELARLK